MSNRLFTRRAALTFGKRGEEGRTVEGLRMRFDIDVNSESGANGAQISVWNLARQSRALLETKKDVVVVLHVGYGNKLGQIFSGDVRTVRHEARRGSTVTIIDAGDAESVLKEAHLEKTYDPGISLKQIIKDIIKTFEKTGEVVVGTLDKLKDKKYASGFSIAGMSKDLLDNLIGKLGAEWSVQNGRVQVVEQRKSNGEDAILLTPQTGLIGSPSKREEGVEFTYLLQSEFMGAGRAVVLKSRSVNGTFVTRRIRYEGDTHSRPWYAHVEALPI